jgi:hypothetical protein
MSGKGDKRRTGKDYGDNFDAIFGKDKKPEGGRYVFDKEIGQMVKIAGRDTGRNVSTLMSDIEPFQSPIDGSVITSRSRLREHHKEHGTTDARDYSAEYYDKAARKRQDSVDCNTPEDKAHRIESLIHATDKHRRR